MSGPLPEGGPEIRIGDRRVGADHPTYVIAEAGVNHRCRLDLAYDLVREAHAAGADAIKFQTYKAETLVTRSGERYWEDDEPTGTQFAIFKRSDLFEADDYRKLAERCAEVGIDFLSTPFDGAAVELLAELGMPAWKIASADVTNAALLEEIAAHAGPVIQSAGASTLEEIAAWLRRAEALGVRERAVLHCVLCYPTATADANLSRIPLLVRRFPEAVIGYSDHTDGTVCLEVSVAAVALGARLIEKHFTLDRSWPGDDHYHSADPDILARMVQAVRATESALGTPYDDILPCEEQARRFARRSLVAARTIPAGTTITRDMLTMKRPGTGLSPLELERVVGRAAAREIPEDTTLTSEDLR